MPEDPKTHWWPPDHRKSQCSTNKTATIKYYNKYSNTIESDKKAKTIKNPSHLPVEAPGHTRFAQSPKLSPRRAASPPLLGLWPPRNAAGCCLGRATAPRNVLLMQSKVKTPKIVKRLWKIHEVPSLREAAHPRLHQEPQIPPSSMLFMIEIIGVLIVWSLLMHFFKFCPCVVVDVNDFNWKLPFFNR